MTLNKKITGSQASKKRQKKQTKQNKTKQKKKQGVCAVKGYEELGRATEIKSLMRQTKFVKVSDFGQVLS